MLEIFIKANLLEIHGCCSGPIRYWVILFSSHEKGRIMLSSFSIISFILSFSIIILLIYMLFSLVFPKGFFKCGRRQGGDETGDTDSQSHGGILARPHPLNFRSWSPQKRYRVITVLSVSISNIVHLFKNLGTFLFDMQVAEEQASCVVKLTFCLCPSSIDTSNLFFTIIEGPVAYVFTCH
jgi:hypothetical protein